MPRKANKESSVRITMTTSKKVETYLHSLVEIGLYGSTVSEVAEQLICEALRKDLNKRRTALLNTEHKP